MIKSWVWLVICLSANLAALGEIRMGVVMNDESSIPKIVLDTFKEELIKFYPTAEIQTFLLPPNGDVTNVRREVLNFYPHINFAIGKEPALFCHSLSIFPFVYTLVLDPFAAGLVDENGQSLVNGTGINVHISPRQQLLELKKEIPSTKFVGTIYSDKSVAYYQKGREAAESIGLSLMGLEASNPDEVSKHFRELSRDGIDSFWLILDPKLLTVNTLKFLVEACEIRKVHLLTFNPNHLKNGASIAVYLDYNLLGKQVAELVFKIMQGSKAREIPLEDITYTKASTNPDYVYTQ